MTQNSTPAGYTEARLMQECYIFFHNNYPHLYGLYFEIHNNAFSARSGAKHKAMGRVPGVADACLLLPDEAGPVFLEFKVDRNKQSDVQINWETVIRLQGYKYHIIHSLTEFQNLLHTLIL
jgi:hypothetical protein